jgi:long-chain acyl-CoA synthetase
MARRSLVEYLEEFQKRGNEPAYVQPSGYRTVRWSYRQVAETAFRFARELAARTIEKGDRVVIWGSNSAEWVSAFFGCALVGAIVVPMDDAATSDFVLRVYGQVRAKLILCSRAHAAIAAAWPVVVLEDLAETLARHAGSPYPAAAVEARDTLQIVFTSGTTAEPKGVVITHGNVLANMAPLETEIRKYLKYERLVHPVRFLNLLPLSHVFGQFLGIFLPQLLGGTVIFEDTLKPAELIRTLRRERVSVLVAVPRLLQSLREKIERDLEDEGRGKKFEQSFSGGCGASSGGSFGPLFPAAQPSIETPKNSGAAWVMPSSRGTGSPRPPRSSA